MWSLHSCIPNRFRKDIDAAVLGTTLLMIWSPCSPRDSQHHSSKASILLHLAFFMVQLSPPYMATGKTIALIVWTFVGKVMSALTIEPFLLWVPVSSELLSQSTVEDSTLPPGASMAKLQHFPPSTSCWQPRPWTQTGLFHHSAPLQLGSLPLSFLLTRASHPPTHTHSTCFMMLPCFLFFLCLSDLSVIIPACLPRHLCLLLQPRLNDTLNFSCILPSSVLPALPIFSPGRLFFSHTFDPGSLSDDDRMANNSSQCFQNHSASRGFFGFYCARHHPKF